jgi:hypothetical protein
MGVAIGSVPTLNREIRLAAAASRGDIVALPIEEFPFRLLDKYLIDLDQIDGKIV